MALSISARSAGAVAVLKCPGRLVEGSEAEALQQQVSDALSESPCIVLDLSQVDFLDSSGLGLLVRLLNRSRAAPGDLKLAAISPEVDTVLRATRLANVFSILATVDEAIAAFSDRIGTAAAAVRPPDALCVDRSPDVLADVREPLRQAGYEAMTSTNIPDALTLLRARLPRMIILGPTMRSQPQTRASAAFADLAAAGAVIQLSDDFSCDDAGDAGRRLIGEVRAKMAAST
jgi:anti-sigma B factor antagonist